MNRQTESYTSPLAGFATRSFCAVRRVELSESVGRQGKCGREVVIKGETEGGGRAIRVNEKKLSFNRGTDKESVSTGGRRREGE